MKHHRPARSDAERGFAPRRRCATLLTAAFLAVVVVAVPNVGASDDPTSRADAAGWQTATPEAMGMDSNVLQGACDYAMREDRHTQGVVVVRGGRLVDECYAPGEGPASWAASWSVAKSYASTLVGIAIDEGKIRDLDVPMTDYYPEWAGTPKAAMTLRHVVMMSSGLQWNENYDPSDALSSDVIQMALVADQLAYAKSRPLAHAPGSVWNYSSGDAMLLSGVIAQATGLSAGEYAQQVLFGPLGMSQVEWWTDAVGNTLTYCCNDTTSRDYARLGHLFANDGVWNGRRIVSTEWVRAATSPVPHSSGRYGYMWWFTTLPEVDGPIWLANGFDNQMIAIIPSLDVVVVRNSDYVKSECPAIADPNLFVRYPPLGLIPGQGTRPPEEWDLAALLRPVVNSVTGATPDDGVDPAPAGAPSERFPDGQATAPCADLGTTPTTGPATTTPQNATADPVGSGAAPPPATAVRAVPAYAG